MAIWAAMPSSFLMDVSTNCNSTVQLIAFQFGTHCHSIHICYVGITDQLLPKYLLIQEISIEKILGLYQIWLYEIRPKPDLAEFRNSSPTGAGFGGTYVRVTETNGINNTVGFCKEAAQFSASFDVTVFDQICGTAINFVFFSSR